MKRANPPKRQGKVSDVVYVVPVAVIGAGELPPVPGSEEWAALPGPSKAEAAYWLRLLSLGLKLAIPDDEREENLARYRLRRIADCVEGKAKWRKPRERPIGQGQAIEVYARLVDDRDPTVPVALALDVVARRFARDHGIADADGEQKVRDAIAEARKRQRRKPAKLGK